MIYQIIHIYKIQDNKDNALTFYGSTTASNKASFGRIFLARSAGTQRVGSWLKPCRSDHHREFLD